MRSHPRSLLGYLLIPRPGDLSKALLFPAGFLLGAATTGWPDQAHLVRALVVWLALELLIYPARYQWNDIRGFDADQRHADGDRGRLPGPWERRQSRIAWSAATASAKVLLAVGAGLLVDPGTALVVGVLAVAVFAIAAVYESLRAVATGRSDVVPAPVTPGVVGIWLVIGSGYALRTTCGLGLAVDIGQPAGLLPAMVATCWLFGVAWITSRWALEATAHATLGRDGRLDWSPARGTDREHQLALVRWLPDRPPVTVGDLRSWQAVRARPSPWAPWCLTGVLALGLAVVTGTLLAEAGPPAATLLVGGAVGLAAGAAVQFAGRYRALAVVTGGAVTAVALALAGADRPLHACLPWLLIAVAQERYLCQDPRSLGRLVRRPMALVSGGSQVERARPATLRRVRT